MLSKIEEPKRFGTLTGGGLAPGLDAVVAYLTKVLKSRGHTVIGIPDGWEGMEEVRTDITMLSDLSRRDLDKLIRSPGSTLGNSRPEINSVDQYRNIADVANNGYKLDGILPIGGDDTLTLARVLEAEVGLKMVGIPKTIDNDVIGTDRTFGFETAYDKAAERIRKMRVEAQGMRRVALARVMGRHAGWIALYAGKAGYADITLIPEFIIDEDILMNRIADIYNEKNGNNMPQRNVVIALAEGYGHGGKSVENMDKEDGAGHGKMENAEVLLEEAIKNRILVTGTGPKTHAVVVDDAIADVKANKGKHMGTSPEIVGYDVRNGEPIASDAIFASELGAYAGEMAANGQFGNIVALRDGKITAVPLSEVSGGRFVDKKYYDLDSMNMRDVPYNIDGGVFDTRNVMGNTLTND